MLSTINKTIGCNANSTIVVDDTNKVVAYMNATINADGNVNINKSIQDKELFSDNKDTVLADFSEFETYVYSLVSSEE